MSYQSKKLWDEVLDNIDQKYANEAAELFGREAIAAEEEIYGEPTPVEVRNLPQTRRKRRFIGSVVGLAAAAAVMVLSVGAAVRYMRSDRLVESVSEESSLSDGAALKNSPDYSELPADPSLYSEDYSIYEKYFFGRWKQTEGIRNYYDERNKVCYVGYAPAENSLFDNYTYRFYDSLGFYEDEQGAYMAAFIYTDSGAVSNAEIVYSPKGDPDILYHYSLYPSDDGSLRGEPDKIFVRDGEYAGENIAALNYLGVRKLCGEIGIDPGVLYESASYYINDFSLERQADTALAVSEGIIVNYRSDDMLEFAMKLALNSNTSLFYNIAVTKENGEWGDPVLTDYTKHYVFVDSIPENTGEVEYDILEEYFFGDWQKDSLLDTGEIYGADIADAVSIMYSDISYDEEQLGGIVSVFRGENGAYAFTDDSMVYFVPENSRQLMYFFVNKNPLNFGIYRLENCATADSSDLYGSLTELGRNRLFDILGSDFEMFYHYFIENEPTADINDTIWWRDTDDILVTELSGNSVSIVHRYYEKAGYGETALVDVFKNNGYEWEHTDTYYDIDCDCTALDMNSFDTESAESLGIYEDVFFGEWLYSGNNYNYIGETAVCSYSEEIFGSALPYAGLDGYYMRRLNGGAAEMFFIPYSDTDSMYYYTDIVDQKRGYSAKYTRSEKQYDKELRDMMTLGSFGLQKLFEEAGGNFSEVFSRVEYRSEYILDRNGVSWKPGIYQGYAASPDFDPVLVSKGDGRVVISQTYYRAQTNDSYTEYDFDSTFENGKLKNFILTFTMRDGVWVCDISDTGESVDTIVSFDMDMSIFPHFMGVWGNSETSYTFDYYNDFCEPYVSWITGFEETDSMWLMLVHRVETGYNSPVIPDETGDTLFVIEKDAPDVVKLYRYENMIPEGDPLRIFTRSEDLNAPVPERGYISIYGLYALMQNYGADAQDLIYEYCFSGSITGAGGEKLYADPSEISKPEYVILERTYDKIKLATTFYSEYQTTAYDYIVTFRSDNSGDSSESWSMYAYEPAIYGLSGAEKLPVDNGSYYAFSGESDGTHLYFYDSSDNIIYELNENIGSLYIYTLNGNDLFVLDCSENCIYRYVGGKAAGSSRICDYQTTEDSIRIQEALAPDFMQFSGEYLLTGAHLDDEMIYEVFAPYRTIDFKPVITSDYLEISENGFTFRSEGELIFRDTSNDSLESILPLLELQYSDVWYSISPDSGALVGQNAYTSDEYAIVIDGLRYLPCYNGLFRSFEDFYEFLGRCFTAECTDYIISEATSVREYNGYLYATGGARGSDLSAAKIERQSVNYIDENHAELTYDVDWDNLTAEETPFESYSITAVKTSEGWRLENFYMPY